MLFHPLPWERAYRTVALQWTIPRLFVGAGSCLPNRCLAIFVTIRSQPNSSSIIVQLLDAVETELLPTSLNKLYTLARRNKGIRQQEKGGSSRRRYKGKYDHEIGISEDDKVEGEDIVGLKGIR